MGGLPTGSLPVSQAGEPTLHDSDDVKWDGLKLRTHSGRLLAAVEPDPEWPLMYRVRIGGHVTDMVNLTRAKDAAVVLAARELNRRAMAEAG
jgi:hypothetical protein